MMNLCRLCQHEQQAQWTVQDAKSGEPLEMSFCAHCGLVQQRQLPSDEDLKIYYSHHYRQDYKATHTPKLKYVQRAGRTAKDRLAFIELAGVEAHGKRLLDIGAGGGEFCFMASKAGFKAQGIEPHQGYSDFARTQYGIAVSTAGIDDLGSEQYDVITLFHVLEHLAHPALAIEKLWHSLTDEGVLIIEVPNLHQPDASPRNIYFKAHLFYYSRFSLMALVSPYFEICSVEDQGNLFMALRKRREPLLQRVMPTPGQIRFTEKRLAQKGWLEYLIHGKGLIKFFSRIDRDVAEKFMTAKSPREVLEKVWGESKQIKHVTAGISFGMLMFACVE